MIRVESPGLLTTVQDLGRPGYAHLGVSASGAADALALRVGNKLVGNSENAAGLEMTLPLPLGTTVSVGVNGVKRALTDRSSIMCTWHEPTPLHAPPHPAKPHPVAGDGVRVTRLQKK